MTLHTVGPADVYEDERVIGKGYTHAVGMLAVIPLVVAYFADTKWVMASGLAVLIPMTNEAGGRLHDLCIRLRRTNLILRDHQKNSNCDTTPSPADKSPRQSP